MSTDKERQEAAALLRVTREGVGVSLAQVAERVGRSRSHLSRCEHGARTPSNKLIITWRQQLGILIANQATSTHVKVGQR